MSQLVTIFGGAGFVGRYVARRMAKSGWRVRVVTRDPAREIFVRTYGVVGQVEPVFANVRDETSIRAVVRGADAVINCVGSMAARGVNSFKAINDEAAGRIARISAEEGVAQLVHISAIGADAGSPSEYARTKAAGEAAVLAAFPSAAILRPSVIFGTEDRFFNKFAGMLGPILPVVGAESRFQPVWVDDVAQSVERVVELNAGGVFELGGPETRTFRELMQGMLAEIRRRKLIVNLPFGIARVVAGLNGAASTLSLGIVPHLITRDQVEALRADNIVAEDARGLADLGIAPTDMTSILPGYLWRFRPSGQYLAIKESAGNIKA